MPLVGEVVVLIFVVVMTLVAYCAALLQRKLEGQRPCLRWFAWVMGTLAATTVFVIWIGLLGLGKVQAGLHGAAFGLLAGIVWGGFFSFINSSVIWRAFDSPTRNYEAEHQQLMNTDIGLLLARLFRGIVGLRPKFAATGVLAWFVLAVVMLLSALWACAFCVITLLTEGAPDVEPVFPIVK
jgi:hypothetical protein